MPDKDKETESTESATTKNVKTEVAVSINIEATTSQTTVPIELTPEQKLNSLKQTGRLIINCFRDEQQEITVSLRNYKYILFNYKNNTGIYSDTEREWILKEFLEPSCTSLMKRGICLLHSLFFF